MPNKPLSDKNGYDITITDTEGNLIARKAAYSLNKASAIRNVIRLFAEELEPYDSFHVSTVEYAYDPINKRRKSDAKNA